MKKILIGVGIVLALAACGGGSSGGPIPNPGPTPTSSPTKSPASHVQWTLIDGQGKQTVAPSVRHANGVGFVQASLMAITCTNCPATNIDNNPAVAPVDVTPSPSPGVSPSPEASPVFAITAPGSGLTPLPAGTYSGYTTVAAGTTWTVNGIATPGLYSVTATYPNGDTGSVPVAAYATFEIAAGWPSYETPSTDPVGWNFTTNTGVTDTTQADIYCTSDGGIHFPYGAMTLPFTTPFGSLSVSQWNQANAVTTVVPSSPGVTSLYVYLFKTSSGAFVKLWPEDTSQNGNCLIYGGYVVSIPPGDFPY